MATSSKRPARKTPTRKTALRQEPPATDSTAEPAAAPRPAAATSHPSPPQPTPVAPHGPAPAGSDPTPPATPRRITFLVCGTPDAQRGATTAGGAAPGESDEVVHAWRLSSENRRTGAAAAATAEQALEAVVGEHIVRLVAADGPELYLHPETARDLLRCTAPEAGAAPARQSAVSRSSGSLASPDDDTVRVHPRLVLPGAGTGPSPAAQRGLLGDLKDWVIDRFEVLKPALPSSLTTALASAAGELAAERIIQWRDGMVTPGVYALQARVAPTPFQPQGLAPLQTLPARPDQRPILVLIHGTFVDTSSTFSKLWGVQQGATGALVQRLFEAYDHAVYALDHRTLGDNPFENARPLVEALEDGAVLHLVSHSRGGLVAEALARLIDLPLDQAATLDAAFQGVDEQLAADAKALHARLHAKRIRVGRIVRAACPARGTLLASGRLDVYLSAIAWLLQRGELPGITAFTEFTKAVARGRMDPRLAPGLRAMMPGSAFVQWLNSAVDTPVTAELRVVAGDLQADGFLSLLKTLAADAFYQCDNDLVVHTASMYGGAPREAGASFVLHQGGDASHFEYFSTPELARAIVDGLTEAQPPHFRTIGPESWAGRDASGVRGVGLGIGGWTGGNRPDQPERPALVLLPGICGSTLDRDDKPLWVGWRLLGGLDKLAYAPGQDRIIASGVIERYYAKLARHLESTHQVTVHPYDWRAPIPEAARGLTEHLRGLLDARTRSGQPVRVLAHSMGGLVARAVQLHDPALWNRLLAQPEGRVLMLGTPNGGSWAPMQMLSDDDDFGRTLTAFGAPLSGGKARQMIAGFPGLLQMQDGLLDPALNLGSQAGWQALADADRDFTRQQNHWQRGGDVDDSHRDLHEVQWGLPDTALLQAARQLRQDFDNQRDHLAPEQARKMLLVVGTAPKTPAGVRVLPGQGVRYLNAPEGGDGRVTHRNACLPGVATWQAGAVHGDLPSLDSAFPAYQELLEQGRTQLLPAFALKVPATGSRAQSEGPGTAVPPQPTEWLPRLRELDATLPPLRGGTEGGGSGRTGGRGPRRQPGPLQVTVVHGNLRYVDRPLFIGHYQSSTLSGTEKVVDEEIGNQNTLSSALRLQAGHYPDRVGMHQGFQRLPALDGSTRPLPEAVVVGLGVEGDLSEAQLTHSVRLAVLDWLQRLHERNACARHEQRPLHKPDIAAVLLGSGGIGIAPGTSARAIVKAVMLANQRAAEVQWPTVADLQLIELYLDRATEAWQALRPVGGSLSGLTLSPAILPANGGKLRPLDGGYRGASRDLVRVVGAGQGRLEFTMDSRRARSEVRGNSTQVALVREMVRAAVPPADADPETLRRRPTPQALGRTLFQLLVPPAVEPHLLDCTELQLDLDDATAALPWELLDPRPDPRDTSSGEPWALRSGLLRSLQMQDERSAGLRDSVGTDDVLVIGDPLLTDPRYRPLPGALEEAQAVADRLGQPCSDAPMTVRSCLQQDALNTITALHERDWRIVHIAGHGYWGQGANEQQSGGGVVLSGDGVYLGPAEVCSLRAVPELVFVNCCHLASVVPLKDHQMKALEHFEHGTFASGVARQLIAQGVRCVVAAGWPVDDNAAKTFATRFYDTLLHGRSFADAVREARRKTWEQEKAEARNGTTWAAYQCYGDPAWRLTERSAGPTATPRPEDRYAGIASAFGLKVALESLEMDARWERDRIAAGRADLAWLDARFGERYGSRGDMAEAFARTWLHHDEVDKALRWYERACGANDGLASLHAQQEMANQAARSALERLRACRGRTTLGVADIEDTLAVIDRALDRLNALVAQRPTMEVHSLVGSAWKRRLMALDLHPTPPEQARTSAQDHMRAAYALARDASASLPASKQLYPMQNLLAADLRRVFILAARPDETTLHALRQQLEACRRLAWADELPDEWQTAARVELALQAALLEERDGEIATVIAQIRTLQRRQPDPKLWRTQLDQLDFLLPADTRPARRKMAQPVKDLLLHLAG
ncbi:MAG: hypothetical protein RIQ53_3033 [Pseudomonadota bacterium]